MPLPLPRTLAARAALAAVAASLAAPAPCAEPPGAAAATGGAAPAPAPPAAADPAPRRARGTAAWTRRATCRPTRGAAGIQYCCSNELRRAPGLSAKLVVTLVVAASGRVTEATMAHSSLGSSRLAECPLAQIRNWRFPEIPEGVTTFQTPFVFTPPE
uniref:Energy transducer TonB n=1 Tax=Eiseniibacteriota bacterium TaxID=2212470 RepID=A0A832HZQ9_UNCEI